MHITYRPVVQSFSQKTLGLSLQTACVFMVIYEWTIILSVYCQLLLPGTVVSSNGRSKCINNLFYSLIVQGVVTDMRQLTFYEGQAISDVVIVPTLINDKREDCDPGKFQRNERHL